MSTWQDMQLKELGIDIDRLEDVVSIGDFKVHSLPEAGIHVICEDDLCYCKRSILDGTSAFNEICSECSGHKDDCWYSPSRYAK